MLTVHVKQGGDEVEVVCDARGIAVLLGALAQLMAARSDTHHLRSPQRGGRDLDVSDPHGRKSVSELRIIYDEAGAS
jgi:hypothetical protein